VHKTYMPMSSSMHGLLLQAQQILCPVEACNPACKGKDLHGSAQHHSATQHAQSLHKCNLAWESSETAGVTV